MMDLPGGVSGKEPACQFRRHRKCVFDTWVAKIPQRRAWQHTPVFLPGKLHEQKSLVGCNPQGHKELDMTEAIQHTRRRIFIKDVLLLIISLTFLFMSVHLFFKQRSKINQSNLLKIGQRMMSQTGFVLKVQKTSLIFSK